MSQEPKHKCTRIGLRPATDFDATHILGTPFPVTIGSGVLQKYCEECGGIKGHIVPEPEQLVAVIALIRAATSTKLSGGEVRFLRKSMNMKAKDLAGLLDLDPSHLSRIENDKAVITEVYERLLRASVCIHHLDAAKGLDVDIHEVLRMKIPSVVCVTRLFSIRLNLEFCEGNSKKLSQIDYSVPEQKKWKDSHKVA